MTHALVIDDDAVYRELIERVLIEAGLSVTVVATGRQALRAARQRLPDIVVTDILMPEMEGVELIFRLRQIDSKLPILAVSGGWPSDRPSLLQFVAQLGATGTLAKPFRAAELIGAVNQCLPPSAERIRVYRA